MNKLLKKVSRIEEYKRKDWDLSFQVISVVRMEIKNL